MLYTITTPYGTWTRKRRDAAAALFMREVYQAIAAQGGLDTVWGVKFNDECKRMAHDVHRGSYLAFDFSKPLPHGAGNVTFKGE